MLHVQEDGEVRGPSPFPCDVASALWCSLFSRFGLSWLCLDGLLICLLVGGLQASRGVLRCGKWRPFASFGAYGGKEIIGALRTWRRPLKNFYPPITLCIFELRLMCSPYLLAFFIFLLISLVRRFLLYTPSVLRGASRF